MSSVSSIKELVNISDVKACFALGRLWAVPTKTNSYLKSIKIKPPIHIDPNVYRITYYLDKFGFEVIDDDFPYIIVWSGTNLFFDNYWTAWGYCERSKGLGK